jgi:hypothetical protein
MSKRPKFYEGEEDKEVEQPIVEEQTKEVNLEPVEEKEIAPLVPPQEVKPIVACKHEFDGWTIMGKCPNCGEGTHKQLACTLCKRIVCKACKNVYGDVA